MNAKLNVSGFSPVSQDELVSVNGGGVVKDIIDAIIGAIIDFFNLIEAETKAAPVVNNRQRGNPRATIVKTAYNHLLVTGSSSTAIRRAGTWQRLFARH